MHALDPEPLVVRKKKLLDPWSPRWHHLALNQLLLESWRWYCVVVRLMSHVRKVRCGCDSSVIMIFIIVLFSAHVSLIKVPCGNKWTTPHYHYCDYRVLPAFTFYFPFGQYTSKIHLPQFTFACHIDVHVF
jgi:hypothetical protein